ncbi:T-cell-specific guanine nucleotide triphosphate-binding protein 1-like [Dendronephthya gigantea]|uniref:T-cell-specific guanine nucleotide triphosphate-binding protein 1-like n=1 Tax=Dendronephthya gigantea TaxID=151771 RepID=UPI001069FE7E|nr:T-cell-specific guanine nucleotide triphosphate-binding protein 1-like [Dendronephthya gigantea]
MSTFKHTFGGYENIDEGLGQPEPLPDEIGVVKGQYLIKENVKKWPEKEIKVGVTGTSGVGKSSLINALRGLDDDDEQAADTGVIGTTSEAGFYPYPNNPKITLVEVPKTTSPTYSRNLKLCDMFLILTATRFRIEERQAAQEIKSMGKSFLLVRTKMDLDEENETKRKRRTSEDIVKGILDNCLENIKDLNIGKDEIFLVSNHDKVKWDFYRLTETIQNMLPTQQKEALIRPVMEKSKDFVNKKVEVWRGQLWMWRVLMYILLPLDILTLGFLSHLISTYPIKWQTKSYLSQLDLPKEGSNEFNEMKPGFKERMKRFYPKYENNFFARYRQRICHPIQIILSPETTSAHLDDVLTGMKVLSMELLDEAATMAIKASH